MDDIQRLNIMDTFGPSDNTKADNNTYKKDLSTVEKTEKQYVVLENTSLQNSMNEKSQQIYNVLAEHYGKDLMQYITPEMSANLLVCYEEAYRLHPSNVKRLSELKLNEFQSLQMLKSFRHRVDLAEEILAGVTNEDLDVLLQAIDSGCDLSEIFTEDGSFINYSFLREKFDKK